MITKIRQWFRNRTTIEQHRCSRPGWPPSGLGEVHQCFCGRKWVADRFRSVDRDIAYLDWVPSLSKI